MCFSRTVGKLNTKVHSVTEILEYHQPDRIKNRHYFRTQFEDHKCARRVVDLLGKKVNLMTAQKHRVADEEKIRPNECT